MPVLAYYYFKPTSSLAYFKNSSRLVTASSCVLQMIGIVEAKTFTELRSRPTSATLARTALTRGAIILGE